MEIKPVNYGDAEAAMFDLLAQFKSWSTAELKSLYQNEMTAFYNKFPPKLYHDNEKIPEKERNKHVIITTCAFTELQKRGIPIE